MSSNIIGKKTIILKNDFVDQDLGAFIVMADMRNKAILLKLDVPLKLAGKIYQHVVASSRLSKYGFDSLYVVGSLGCSLTWVPDEKYDPNNPMDLSWWRGGAAAITDLYIN